MSSGKFEDENKQRESAGVPLTLRLRSPTSTRQTLARVIREYGRGNLDRDMYKDLVWGISQFLGAFRIERDLEIEKRLQEIEDQLNGGAR